MAQNFYPFVLVGNRMEISKQCVYVYKIAGNCDIEEGKNILEELFKENFLIGRRESFVVPFIQDIPRARNRIKFSGCDLLR